jgi:hypothetical protein
MSIMPTHEEVREKEFDFSTFTNEQLADLVAGGGESSKAAFLELKDRGDRGKKIDHQAEQTRLLRSIRNYVAWAFWLAVAPAILVAAIYLLTLAR